MDYRRLVGLIPAAKYEELSNRLVDFILTSKNDEKMPSQLANTMLRYWQENALEGEVGLTALLEAAFVLEPEKTITALNELQITNVAEEIKAALAS